ncbi:MAG: PLP-dependent aminotransferase family protein [Lachnospiraceae bacterium]|nr:PLP-dependent aminotransferase family protein [Lachnospiraceae bacterium]
MFDSNALFSKAFAGLKGNIIRELYQYTSQPGFISFAGGNPSPETFPNEELAEIASKVLKENSIACLQYGVSNGILSLREYIAGQMTEEGVPAKAENVVITSGSQQSMDLLSKAMLNPGDRVLVESPTYVAALKIFGIYGARVEAVASDDEGIIPEALQEKLETGPAKLIYLIPNFQNPTGITLPWERRKRIMEIVKKHNVLVIEDDPYGKLRYSGDPVPHMKTLDEAGQVAYFGSFSKIIAPGLRMAYVVCQEAVARKLVLGKQNNDMHTPNLTQLIVNEYCRRGRLQAHIEECCLVYKKKRDTMLSLLDTHFPKEMRWTRPDGGLFLWSKLPEGYSSMKLLEYAIPAKVAYVPGDSFFADGSGVNTMRLNFSNASKADMEKGIALLGEQIGQYLKDGK